MRANEYQRLCLRTAQAEPPTLTPHQTRILNWALSLNEEAGEVAGPIKKWLFAGHAIDRELVEKELGDVAFYLSVLAWEFGLPLGKVMDANIEKLKRRYPEGFSSEASIERRDER